MFKGMSRATSQFRRMRNTNQMESEGVVTDTAEQLCRSESSSSYKLLSLSELPSLLGDTVKTLEGKCFYFQAGEGSSFQPPSLRKGTRLTGICFVLFARQSH